jgi:hypothetical protein
VNVSQVVHQQVSSASGDGHQVITLAYLYHHYIIGLFRLNARLRYLEERMTFRLELAMLDKELFKPQLVLLVVIELRFGVPLFYEGFVGVAYGKERVGVVEVKGK